MRSRTRLAIAVVVGATTAAVTAFLTPWQVTCLLGWDAAAATWAGSVWFAILGKDADATRATARVEDDSRAVSELILICASVASLVGVAFALVKAAAEKGGGHAAITAVAAVTVVLSWAVVHTRFTLRYARLYYAEEGGIDYHDNRAPDFGDFAYVAFTLGMTYQVSDSDITSKVIRMAALRHALLSYLFGTVVVAMTI
ncbi:MAG TPA: DUF1345 domain-containing protein, partial [Acidimicrobiales bacterium]